MNDVILWMQNEISNDLFNKGVLIISAIFSALLSGMVFYKEKNRMWKVLVTSLLMYLIVGGLTLLMIYVIFRFVPQRESFGVLLKKIAEKNWTECLIPLTATMLAGILINSVIKGRKIASVFFCFSLGCSAVMSSGMFFWNSFQIVQRPQYAVPVEAISAIVNTRLSAYPMEFTGSDLEQIEIEEEKRVNLASEPDPQPEGRRLPDNFVEFLDCIIDGTYVLGMGPEDYLEEAYQLYSDGRHDNNYFYMGVMWTYLWSYDFFGWSDERYINEALRAYKQEEEINGGGWDLYSNMASLYERMGDKKSIRKCMHKAMKCGTQDESNSEILRRYKEYVYAWMDGEDSDPELLMDDAYRIVGKEANASMYILYGAYAADQNKNVKKAYQLLSKADKHYKGKNVMIKILKCICADLAGIDKTDELKNIYKLEKRAGELTLEQETYLIRYLFATNRFDELWGYIADVGTADADPLDPEKATIKSEWYFKNQDKLASDMEDVTSLLAKVNGELEKDEPTAKERNFLLLSQMLLRSCLGQEEPHNDEEYEVEGVSDLKYVFLAVNAFNDEKYGEAIAYCENFFEMIDLHKEKGKKTDKDQRSIHNLEPQEQVILRYQVQLILAHSHFEYAMELKKGSDQWKKHMKRAEEECDAFEQSSKSLYYIGEQFKMLQNSIDIQNQKLPEGENGVVEV